MQSCTAGYLRRYMSKAPGGRIKYSPHDFFGSKIFQIIINSNKLYVFSILASSFNSIVGNSTTGWHDQNKYTRRLKKYWPRCALWILQ
jgi:hypothetical protein